MKAFHQMNIQEREDYKVNLKKILKEQVDAQNAVVKALNYVAYLLHLKVKSMPGGIDYTKK
jgi:hypothetical protein